MPWTGYPETMVTQLTYTEWTFGLRAHREVQIGYSIRVAGAWELFGNDHWVWFTGALASYRGAVQIVSQWAEVEPLGSWERVWQWVHWRNPSTEDVFVQPYVLLAPPIDDRSLMQSRATQARRRIWTLVDLTTDMVAAGTVLTGPGDGPGGGGRDGAGARGLEASVALRPLAGQRLRQVAIEGDLRHVPIQELWGRVGALRAPRERPRGARRRRATRSRLRRRRS
jgi:hypothetical protein